MVLVSQVDDRRSVHRYIRIYYVMTDTTHAITYGILYYRAIAGLFNVAHEMSRGSQDPSFPRLGQMLTEYDHALKKISEDFTPLSKVKCVCV